jgi:hypothetical protein
LVFEVLAIWVDTIESEVEKGLIGGSFLYNPGVYLLDLLIDCCVYAFLSQLFRELSQGVLVERLRRYNGNHKETHSYRFEKND